MASSCCPATPASASRGCSPSCCADAAALGWSTAVGHCVGQAGSSLAYLPFVELVGALDSRAPRGRRARARHAPEPAPPAPRSPRRRARAGSRTPARRSRRPSGRDRSRPGGRGRPRPAHRVRRRESHSRRRGGRALGRPLLPRPAHAAADPRFRHRRRPCRQLSLRRPPPPPPAPRHPRRLGPHRRPRPRRPRAAVRLGRARARRRPRGRTRRRRDGRRDRAPRRGQPVLRRGARRQRRRRPVAHRWPEPCAARPGRPARRHDPTGAARHRPQGRPAPRARAALPRRRPARRDARGRARRGRREARPRGVVASGLHLPPRPPRRGRRRHAPAGRAAAPPPGVCRRAGRAPRPRTRVRARPARRRGRRPADGRRREPCRSRGRDGGRRSAGSPAHLERALSWLDEDDAERDEVTLLASRAAMVAGEPVRAIDLLRDRLDHPGRSQHPTRAPTCSPRSSSGHGSSTCRSTPSRSPTRRWRSSTRPPTSAGCGCCSPACRRSSTSAPSSRQPSSATRCRSSRSASAWAARWPRCAPSWRGCSRRRRTSAAVEEHLHAVVADIDPDDPLLLRALHQLASLAHRRGDLAGALAQYDAGAAVARRMHREWAPWGQECRLLGGLTAYELGDWDAAAQPARPLRGSGASAGAGDLLRGGTALISAGRGEPLDRDVLEGLRDWWPVDGLCVVLTVMPGVELLGQDGDLDGMLELAEAASAAPRRGLGRVLRRGAARRARRRAGRAAAGARRRRAAEPRRGARRRPRRAGATGHRPSVRPSRRRVGPSSSARSNDSFEDTSREAWAWMARLEAEVLRVSAGCRHRRPADRRRARRGVALERRGVRTLRTRLRGGPLAGPAGRGAARGR